MSKKDIKDTTGTKRIPIITILGHVDHGKTTILDKIRNSNVQEKEAGGITQKISVFTIEHPNLDANHTEFSKLTFVDTPGHEAFDLMRQRGGEIADIVLLIVAADDGLKPQTLESIEVIKNTGVKPIVVINKVDLPNTNIETIKRELSTKGIQVEGYGGDVPVVEVSGKTGAGISDLLDTITLLIDVEGLDEDKELPKEALSKAFVLESIKDGSTGLVSTIIVTGGEMASGDWVVYLDNNKTELEKVKGFVSETGETTKLLVAGQGGKIIGLSSLIGLGTEIYTIKDKDKKLAASIVTPTKIEKISTKVLEGGEEEDVAWFSEMFDDGIVEVDGEEKKPLNVIIKSSSEGSLQALLSSIAKVNVDGYVANVVASSVGDITTGDVEMAEVTKSIILGFEVSADNTVKKEARTRKVLIREYEIIYKLIEEITHVLTAMSAPKETEEDLGDAEVREIFILSDGSKVLGCRVSNGLIKRGEKCYIVRDDEIVAEGKLTSLKHSKADVKEAPKGSDFGAIITPSPKAAEVGDKLFCVHVSK